MNRPAFKIAASHTWGRRSFASHVALPAFVGLTAWAVLATVSAVEAKRAHPKCIDRRVLDMVLKDNWILANQLEKEQAVLPGLPDAEFLKLWKEIETGDYPWIIK